MPFFGQPTLHDCKTLVRHVEPRARALKAAFDGARMSWEGQDVFGAERFAKDLHGLQVRWGRAVRHAKNIRPEPAGARVTPAPRAFAGLVRAVRQGPARGAVVSGDLVDLQMRLARACRGLSGASIGFDLMHPLDSFDAWAGGTKSLADCLNVIAEFGPLIQSMQDRWNVVQAGWTTKDSATANAFSSAFGQLRDEWASAVLAVAVKAGVPNAAQLPAADMVALLRGRSDGDSTPAPVEYLSLLNLSTSVHPLTDRLTVGAGLSGVPASQIPAYAGTVQPPKTSSDTFYAGTTGVAKAVDRTLDAAGKAAVDPYAILQNPWVVGAGIVGGLGVLAFTLGEVRALVGR